MLRAFLPLIVLAAAPAALAVPGTFDGLVLPFKEVVVSSPVQASIDAIMVKEGDTVAVGTPLAQLYSRIEQLDMLRTKADLEKKDFDFKGSKNLFAEKIISEDEALKNKIELELAKLQYETAAEIYRQRSITAPIAGIVVEKLHEAGESVTPSQPLFRLVDISKVYVQFYVKAEDLSLIHTGDTMRVRCPVIGADRIFRGKVDFIDPRVDAASGLMRVKVLLPNPEGEIKAGIRAEVSLDSQG